LTSRAMPLLHTSPTLALSLSFAITLNTHHCSWFAALMLRYLVGKMVHLRALLSFVSLFSSVSAQSYILQDDYSIANFFDMFSFYTVSEGTVRSKTNTYLL
jgi:hypothetical protein